MDWRAKSQSRSRSRADMGGMDWRAQSRSRSRAPDFRAPRPPSLANVEVSSVTAQFSRFHNDTGGVVASPPAEDVLSLAASLGLSPDFLDNTAASFPSSTALDPFASPSPFSFPSDSQSPEGASNHPNLTAIENTLNQLISLQSLAGSTPRSTSSSPWPTSPPPPNEDSPAKSPNPLSAPFANAYADTTSLNDPSAVEPPADLPSSISSYTAGLGKFEQATSAAHLQQMVSFRLRTFLCPVSNVAFRRASHFLSLAQLAVSPRDRSVHPFLDIFPPIFPTPTRPRLFLPILDPSPSPRPELLD